VDPSPSIPAFVATVVAVTASGALMPGPLFTATVLQGTKGGAKSGLMISVGHTLVELPLALLIGLGISGLMSFPGLSVTVGLTGGSALIVFGVLQAREAIRLPATLEPIEAGKFSKRALIIGVGFTGLNPYFIVWWFTVGLGLIAQAVELGALLGVVLMYVAHVWMDFAFLTGCAYLSARGKTLVGTRGYKYLLIALAVLLIYFGVSFIARGAFQFNMPP